MAAETTSAGWVAQSHDGVTVPGRSLAPSAGGTDERVSDAPKLPPSPSEALSQSVKARACRRDFQSNLPVSAAAI